MIAGDGWSPALVAGIAISVAVVNLLWFVANATGLWRETGAESIRAGGFKVVLEETAGRELDLIKALRESLGIDYAGAKAMVNSLPSILCSRVSHEDAR